MDKMQRLIHEANSDLSTATFKSGLGFLSAGAAMTLNDWAGLIVAFLTAIYMILQIEIAWHKRKIAKKHRLEPDDE